MRISRCVNSKNGMSSCNILSKIIIWTILISLIICGVMPFLAAGLIAAIFGISILTLIFWS